MLVLVAFNAGYAKIVIPAQIDIVVGRIIVFIDIQIFFGQIAIFDDLYLLLLDFLIRDRCFDLSTGSGTQA